MARTSACWTRFPPGHFDLIYMDPPFNTGRAQRRHTLAVTADPAGARVGFGGRRYDSRLLSTLSYDDEFSDYLAFLEPRLTRARAACSRPTARCTSTSTTERPTTASCCSMSCSAATLSSTS